MKKYYRVWKIWAFNALQTTFVNRGSNALFFLGKLVRMATTLLFLLVLTQQVPQFGQYSTDELLIFYITFHFLDVGAQILFRGVYMFQEKVRTGEFDYHLARPINPLFQALFDEPDINDVLFLLPSIGIAAWVVSSLDLTISLTSVLLYLALVFNGFLIATGFHILVLALGILTTEVDNAILLYRDLTRLARFPVTIYPFALRLLFFYVMPIGIMMTTPTEVLLQQPASVSLPLAFGIGIGFFGLSLWAWQRSVRHYSSASS